MNPRKISDVLANLGSKTPRGARWLWPHYTAWRLSRSKSHGILVDLLFAILFYLAGFVLAVIGRVIYAVNGKSVMVFNVDALGHQVNEFATLLHQGRQNPSCLPGIIFAPKPQAAPHTNAKLFEIWSTLSSPHQIRLAFLGWLPWSICVVAASWSEGLRGGILGLTPAHSAFSILPSQDVVLIRSHVRRAVRGRIAERCLGGDLDGYVVVAIRDDYYHGYKSNRSSDPRDYVPAICFLLDSGFPVVRIGRRSGRPLNIDHPRYLDYAWSADQSDSLDLLLWTHASFAIGDSTGVLDALSAFGIPVLCPTYPLDPRSFVSIPNFSFATQGIRDARLGRVIKIHEVVELMNMGVNLGDPSDLLLHGLEPCGNSAAEILQVTQWFINAVINRDSDLLADARQEQRLLLRILDSRDRNQYRHYRMDALYAPNWCAGFRSLMYPGSVERLLKDPDLTGRA